MTVSAISLDLPSNRITLQFLQTAQVPLSPILPCPKTWLSRSAQLLREGPTTAPEFFLKTIPSRTRHAMIHWRLADFGPLGQTMLEKLKQHGFRARKEGG